MNFFGGVFRVNLGRASQEMSERRKIVIIGGGFGGLTAAKALGGKDVDVIVIDRKNHHTFQPLLYQVASAVLSPGEIASPIRRILQGHRNVKVILGEVVGFDIPRDLVLMADGSEIGFDYLIVAAGARHSYFGHDEWETHAPGLKTLEDALEIRRRVLLAFEHAERDAYLTGVAKHLNFIVIGGGATGVEIAGAIAGIAREALAKDFSLIDTRRALVQLFEGGDRILNTFSPSLSGSAKTQLEDLGVEVYLNSMVTAVEAGRVMVGDKWIDCDVAIWATGVAASPLGKMIGEAAGAETDRAGRIKVNKDLSVAAHSNIFVIGDMVSLEWKDGKIVPGVAPAAMQMADLAAANIVGDLKGNPRNDFKYFDKGSMATIGRSRAIAETGRFKMTGFVAWLAWLFVHLISLIGFRNRIYVLSEWFWAYLTRERSARLITGDADEMADALRFLDAKAANMETKSVTKPKTKRIKKDAA
jgi:NADH dehydrogenase